MSESVAAPAPAAAPAASTAPPDAPAEQPKSEAAATEEMIDLLLDGEEKPRKVPVSKVNPHLDKLRREADRRMSEADRASKSANERASKLEAVLRAAKEDTDGVLRELGIDPDEYAERKLSARVKAALQAQEEEADPAKKSAREQSEELERLRKAAKEREDADKKTAREQTMGKLRAAVNAVVAKLPEQIRGDATADVIAVFRQALAEKRDITIEDAAKATQGLIRARARAALESDDELRAAFTAKAPVPAVKPTQHPAAKPSTRDDKGKFKPPENMDGAGDILQRMMRGKF